MRQDIDNNMIPVSQGIAEGRRRHDSPQERDDLIRAAERDVKDPHNDIARGENHQGHKGDAARRHHGLVEDKIELI